jgi:hypothetical protein
MRNALGRAPAGSITEPIRERWKIVDKRQNLI